MRVLITGPAGGRGAAAQAMFAREGARIAGCDIQPGAAEKTADALSADGFDVHGETVDISDPVAAERWIAPLGQPAHAAAKAGVVVALTWTLAADDAPDGIRANAISPGSSRHRPPMPPPETSFVRSR